MAVLGNFDGWYQATLSAGEIRQPERNLPLGMIGGTALVGLLYLLVNIVYFRALPIAAFGASSRIGEEATTALLGPAAGRFLAAVILVSIFGCISSTIIGASRLGLPMAEDAAALRWLARIHPRYRTPSAGIVTLGVWSIVLVMSGSYEALFNYALFASFIFHVITAVALFTLRRQQPKTPRPYRVFGYPYVPALFLVAMTGLVLNTLRERPVESLLGVGIVALGRAACSSGNSRQPRNERGPVNRASPCCVPFARCDGLATVSSVRCDGYAGGGGAVQKSGRGLIVGIALRYS